MTRSTRRPDRGADTRRHRHRRRGRRPAAIRAACREDSRRAPRALRGRRPPLLLAGAGAVRRAPRGVPVLTLDRWIRDRARLTPDRVAIDYQGREVDLRASSSERSDELARGLSHGDRVATLTGNTPEHVARLLGVREGGGDPDADLVASIAARDRLPARRRRAVALHRRGRVRGAGRGGARARSRRAGSDDRPAQTPCAASRTTRCS